MKFNNNILVFENDAEFEDFAVDPQLIVSKMNIGNNQEILYTDFNFTHDYYKAIEEGKMFEIKDKNSRIMKNGDISYRTITKKVENLV